MPKTDKLKSLVVIERKSATREALPQCQDHFYCSDPVLQRRAFFICFTLSSSFPDLQLSGLG